MSAGTPFGSWLRQRRKEQGVGPEELAEQIGCSEITIRKIEAGERRPSRQVALLLAAYFHVPEDELEAFVAYARTGQTKDEERKAKESDSSVAGAPPTIAPNTRAPWRVTYARQTNLPAPLTRLIGREREEEAARELILDAKTRLLTLTGAPGIGKTRLALQVAWSILDHFTGGVYFVDLAPIVDPGQVLPAVARTLALRESKNQSIEDVLLDYLREERLLLLLDNFEQVLDSAPNVVRILESGPWLKVLVTSRQALRVRGERRFAVPTLGQPDPNVAWTMDRLASYPSVQLFIERARAVSPDYSIAKAEAADVAALCVGLEGLPLAIELAATRADHLSPREMRAALGNRLSLLTRGASDLPTRQRTLRSAIEWSYQLLAEAESSLFRRLGVFVGGFTEDAIAAVCPPLSEAGMTLLDTVLSLVDKHLVTKVTQGQGGQSRRFSTLESIREYALELLARTGEIVQVKRLHAEYFLFIVEQAEAELQGANQGIWLNRLNSERDNVLAALEWSRERQARVGGKHKTAGSGSDDYSEETEDAAEIGLRMAAALPRYWYKSGLIAEGRAQLAAILASAPREKKLRPFRAKALLSAGILAHLHGDYTAARGCYEESLALRRELDDKQEIAIALSQLAMAIDEQGEEGAMPLFEEALAIRRELGDQAGIAASLNQLGVRALERGDSALARRYYEEGLAYRREVGDRSGTAYSLGNLGHLAFLEREYDHARLYLEECLAIWREFGNKAGIANALGTLGSTIFAQGDYAAAGSLLRESLSLYRELDSKIHIPAELVDLGVLELNTGAPIQGARLLGAAAAQWDALRFVPEQWVQHAFEHGVATARAELGDDEFTRAFDEGKAMPLREAIAAALGENVIPAHAS